VTGTRLAKRERADVAEAMATMKLGDNQFEGASPNAPSRKSSSIDSAAALVGVSPAAASGDTETSERRAPGLCYRPPRGSLWPTVFTMPFPGRQTHTGFPAVPVHRCQERDLRRGQSGRERRA
jgi:hypothetical protein